MSHKTILLAACSALALGTPVLAQEHMMGQSALPQACTADAAVADPMKDMKMGTETPKGTDQAHMDLGAGMGRMNSDMEVGMMVEDIDVAFVCSMIAHHRGAIDMAKAELAHGDEPWAKEMAQKVIAAQEQEIKDMTAWLEQR